MTLAEKIKDFVFYPEVYLYPTPRVYGPLEDFSLEQVDFGDDIDLYLHIPFCRQICSYCGYLKVLDQVQLRKRYVDTVIKEIRMYKDVLSDKTVKTLHIGGGTPSLLDPYDIENLFDALLDANPNLLDTSTEVSIEATPESVEFNKFSRYKRLGINRVSMGVQTLNNSEIALSRRNNISNISLNAIETLRTIGIPNIVIDLMIGIQGQTVDSFIDSLEELIQIRPDTVELYALGIMPNTSLGLNPIDLMSKKDVYDCYDIARKLFLEAGYIQDCHNRYAIPKKGSYFQEDHVFEGNGLIGFGAGARSYGKNIHFRNFYDLSHPSVAILNYIDSVQLDFLPAKTGVILSPDDKLRQYSIYNIENLDLVEFRKRFNIDFSEKFPELYNELLELDLATVENSSIRLTTNGLNFRDLIAHELFSDQIKSIEEKYRPNDK